MASLKKNQRATTETSSSSRNQLESDNVESDTETLTASVDSSRVSIDSAKFNKENNPVKTLTSNEQNSAFYVNDIVW